MKLIARYNQYNFPSLVFIFLITSVLSYFFVTQVLLRELDEHLLFAVRAIKSYTKVENKIPEIIPMSNQIIEFKRIDGPISDTGFQTTNPQMPNKKKRHLYRKFTFVLPVNKDLYKVSVSSPLEGTDRMLTVILTMTISAILLITLVSLLVNRIILSRLWSPFYESIRILRKFRIDQPEPPVFPKTNISEFSFLLDALKTSLTNEAQTFQALKEFAENASHEIQTPIAIIRSKLDMLIQHQGFSEEQSESARTIYSAIDKLSRLNQSLLLLTKIGNRQFEEQTIINLSYKVKEKITQFEELWKSNNIRVESKLYDTTIKANRELIDILLNNLLSNATKYNVSPGVIYLELSLNALIVSNKGQEYPLDERKIFKRFYKAKQYSETNGLGLSIVKQICDVSLITPYYQYSNGMHRFIFKWES